MNKNYIIELKNVYKSFDSKQVHTGVNLSIRSGENITVLGGSDLPNYYKAQDMHDGPLSTWPFG